MHIEARLLVVSVFDIGTTKTQKLCFLKSRTGGSFALSSQKFDSYFVLPVVSHVDTPGFLWAKTVHQSEELSYLWLATPPILSKAGMLFVSQNEEACSTVSSDSGSIVCVLSSLPIAFLCQALAIEESMRNKEPFFFFLCSYVFLGVTMWFHVPQRPRMLSW